MDPLKERLTHLWMRQDTPVFPLETGQGQVPKRMGLTFLEPMKISGSTLLPGRYVFRLVEPGTERNRVEIFNEDQTRLVAEITPVLDN
ncbi:MAG: hypothetical protein ABSF71_01045 [Terriglobia bacterium]|jgi:hypothetical protein